MRFQEETGRAGLSIVEGAGSHLPLESIKVKIDTATCRGSGVENGGWRRSC